MLTIVCVLGRTPSGVAVVGIGAPPPSVEQLQLAKRQLQNHKNLLSDQALLRRLLAMETPHDPSPAALRDMLQDARDREARFDGTAAIALWSQILVAFDHSSRRSTELVEIAGAAAYDMVAARMAQGAMSKAQELARDALLQFGSIKPDAARHPPAVLELINAQKAVLAASEHATLRVTSDRPGRLFADGTELGHLDSNARYSIPLGEYRLWLLGDDGEPSLPYPVVLSEGDAHVRIYAAMDAVLSLVPTVSLQCAKRCREELTVLGNRVHAARIIGVASLAPNAPSNLSISLPDGPVDQWPSGTMHSSRPSFSPLYLVPFGVGQLRQDRPVFAGSYATAEAGLLAWHIISWRRHSSAMSRGDYEAEPHLRRQRNLSAITFYSALGASIIEALAVGILSGE